MLLAFRYSLLALSLLSVAPASAQTETVGVGDIGRPASGPAPAAGWPVVVFSHGMGGSRRGYSYLGSYWAAHGFVAMHVQHIGSDRRLWAGGSPSAVRRCCAARGG